MCTFHKECSRKTKCRIRNCKGRYSRPRDWHSKESRFGCRPGHYWVGWRRSYLQFWVRCFSRRICWQASNRDEQFCCRGGPGVPLGFPCQWAIFKTRRSLRSSYTCSWWGTRIRGQLLTGHRFPQVP